MASLRPGAIRSAGQVIGIQAMSTYSLLFSSIHARRSSAPTTSCPVFRASSIAPKPANSDEASMASICGLMMAMLSLLCSPLPVMIAKPPSGTAMSPRARHSSEDATGERDGRDHAVQVDLAALHLGKSSRSTASAYRRAAVSRSPQASHASRCI